MKTRVISITLVLISLLFVSCGKSKQDKIDIIINKLNLIENQKSILNFQIEALKDQAIGEDSLKVIEMERLFSDKEIADRIIQIFNENLSDKEINDIYNFVQSSAYDKFFESGELFKAIETQFSEINDKIDRITKNVKEQFEEPTKKFVPIPVDRENGFYATVDYNFSKENKDIKLEEKPSLTTKDILKVEKVLSNHNEIREISIVFTKEGAKKFYILTKENIGKPIAIVLAKEIVSMPTVNAEITGGRASINGNFSEKEIEKMIELLREK